ncbi:MAG: hypothetical protein DBY17_04995 [Oscillospiraceae bacterium]|nr:MAG: hypothetical protein DBY17_04995 [Oscillospiraceae bacterium]
MRGKAPAPAGAVQKSPCLIRHIIQTSPHVSRPACHGGLFILHLLRRGNPFRPTAGRFMGRGLLPAHSR